MEVYKQEKKIKLRKKNRRGMRKRRKGRNKKVSDGGIYGYE